MSDVAVRWPAKPVRVVFDGQSLNLLPGNEPPVFPFEPICGPEHVPYPDRLMIGFIPGDVPWTNVAVGGQSWTVLSGTAATRLFPIASSPPTTANVLVMVGGSHDIFENDTGAQAYADHKSYADAARAQGFGPIIVGTVLGNTLNTGPQETARQACNALLLANADNAFEYVIDFESSDVADWTDPTYYFDGLHWNAAGAQLAAEVAAPIVWDAIADAMT